MNILYVEDDPHDADLTRRELAKTMPDLALDRASTLGEAMALLQRAVPYDLVLTDLKLPDGDGLTLLNYIRARGFSSAVVILTGQGDEDTAIAALRAGADDYCTKRLDYWARLPAILESALQRFRTQVSRRAHPLHVLYAEHNAADVDLTRRHLARYAPHIHLDVVSTAQEVLARIGAAGACDVLLIDYRLHGLNALELLKELRQQRAAKIPVVLITGQGDEEIAVQAFKLGASDYVPKTSGYLFPLTSTLENAFYRGELEREQAALRQTELSFRHLFASNPHPMWVYDLATLDFLEVNEAAVAKYGYSRDEFLHMRLTDIRPEDEQARFLADLGRPRPALQFSGEWRHRLKDGTVIDVEVTSHLLEFAGRKAALLVAQDITARKVAEAQVETRARQLALLYDAGLVLNHTLDPRALMDSLLQIAGQTVGANRADFFRFEPASQALVYEAGAGYGETLDIATLQTQTFALGAANGVVGRVAAERQLLYLPDVTRNPDWIPFDAAIRSGLWVPVERERQLRGVLVMTSTRPDAFTPDDQKLVALFANQVAVALENARLFDETRRRLAELEAVNKISAVIRVDATPEEMMTHLLDETLAMLGSDTGLITRYDPKRRELRDVAGRGWCADVTAVPIKPREGIMGHVFATGEPYVSRDIAGDPQLFPAMRERIPAGWGGVCVPIRAGTERLGVLFVGVPADCVFMPEQERLLMTIAEMAGRAIHRMQLTAETQRGLERLSALRAIDVAINNSLDLRLTLGTLLDQALLQLQVDAAEIRLLNKSDLTLEHVVSRGFRQRGRQTRLRLGEDVAGRPAVERRTVCVPDLAGDIEDSVQSRWLAAEGLVSYYGAPLIAKGEVKGVIGIFKRSRLDPDADWVNFLEALAGQAAIAVDSAELFEGLQHANSELVSAYDATLEGWSRALDLRDKETEGHTERVTELTLRLAQELGIPKTQLVHIRRGALLHDIGKVGVPDSVLLKPGPLSEQEWEIMRQHPQFAFEMLASIPYLRPALDIPYYHHEKWDGTGYPRGLKGEEIPLVARLFAVVDVWDALTSDRPYRAAWPADRALEYIREQAGRHFDPQVVQAFLGLEPWRPLRGE